MTEAVSVDGAPPKARFTRRAVRWLVSLAAVAFIVWMLPLRDRCSPEGVCEDGLISTFRRTRLTLVFGFFGLYLASTLAWSSRWRELLHLASVKLKPVEAWRLTVEAQAGGVLLPGGVGGDALRVAYVKERVPSASLTKVAASIVLDRMLGLVTLALMPLVLDVAVDAGSKERQLVVPVLAAMTLLSTGGWLGLRHVSKRSWRPDAWLLRGRLGQHVVQPLLEFAAAPAATRVLGRALLFSAVVSTAQLGVVRGLVSSLGIAPTSEVTLLVGVSFAMVLAAIPAAPGGWGTAEAAYVFCLAPAGVKPAAATAVCVLYRLMWYALATLGAASALSRSDRGKGT